MSTGITDAAAREPDRVADGEAAAAAADDEADGDGVLCTVVAGPGAPVAAALCPVSVTTSRTATPTAASTPTARAAPERKLISSKRA